jgi:hypothetical protein
MENENNISIDNEAKGHIYLREKTDKDGNPFFIGKLQIPCTLEFDKGIVFMVFVSDKGEEEIQFAPLDPRRLRRAKENSSSFGVRGGRLCIDLHPVIDKDNETFYVGEAIGPINMNLRQGIFLTVFLSREGKEELQMSPLKHKARETREDFEEDRIEYRDHG